MHERSVPVWAFHTLGAVQEVINRGVVPTGINLLLTSNVPHGAGMSNSASNCVALGLAFNAMCVLLFCPPYDLALLRVLHVIG